MADLCRLLEARPSGVSAATERGQRVLMDHRSIPGSAGEYLVPRAPVRSAVRPLVAYHRLRPRRPRAARLAIAGAVGLGLGGLLGSRRRVPASPGADLLLDHLAAVLGEDRLGFAGTARPCREFVTPVLQLLRPDGRTVAFAKLGWDAVTDAMVDTEAAALARLGAHPVVGLRAPEVLWHGVWAGRAVLVTAPMPPGVRRRRTGAAIPVEPLRALAELDGPVVRGPLRGSGHWAAARDTAEVERAHGDGSLVERLDDIEAAAGDAEFEYGRWHGDWVEWNLAEDRGALHAWDWAYSGPGLPFGLDVLHHPYLRHRVVGGMDAATASRRALEDAAPSLRALGVPTEIHPALAALLRLELDLRVVRARRRRDPATAAEGGAR